MQFVQCVPFVQYVHLPFWVYCCIRPTFSIAFHPLDVCNVFNLINLLNVFDVFNVPVFSFGSVVLLVRFASLCAIGSHYSICAQLVQCVQCVQCVNFVQCVRFYLLGFNALVVHVVPLCPIC